ncbi:stalk domain-containing protein [Rossellomorea sp. NPDC077527]|uniref:stalk domain-containing protein n=1 Tax=Rossellomorea sp. NPDC077527 TaxID=3364510 RepID=UPI0037C50E66
MKIISIISTTVLLVSLLSASPVAFAQSQGEQDVAKMYLEQHELKMSKNSSKAVFDGKSISADPYINRNGRTFVPIKLIRDLDIGTVQWDNKKKTVQIALREEYLNRRIGFQAGNKYSLNSDGTTDTYNSIPIPFIYNGRLYIPVKAMPDLGISVGYDKGNLVWRWSEKIIEILKPEMHSTSSAVSFTVLYQDSILAPHFLESTGNGGFGYSGHNIEKNIKLDNKTFNRVQFEKTINPGINPVTITANSMGSKQFEIIWRPKENIPVTPDDHQYLNVDKPASKYVQLRTGESFTLGGTIKENEVAVNYLTILLYKYENHQFTSLSNDKILVHNKKFSQEFSFSEPGKYFLNIYSPDIFYGPIRVDHWGDLMVEVK